MGSLTEQDVKIARRKGITSVAVVGGGIFLLIAGHPLLGVVALAASAYLGWDWFSFRAKRGMRL